MRRFLSSLRGRVCLLVVLAVIPALGMIVLSGLDQRRMAAARAQEEALRLARLAADEYDDLSHSARDLLGTLAELPEVRSRDPVACRALLSRLATRHPHYTTLFVATPHGDVFCTALAKPLPLNVADRSYFRRAVTTRHFAIGDDQISRITGTPNVVFAHPVLDESDQVTAVVAAALDLSWFNGVVASAELPPGSTLRLVDRHGTILARHPDPERWVGRPAPVNPLVRAMLTHGDEGAAETVGVDGYPRLHAFTRLGRAADFAGLTLSVGIPTEVAYADSHRIVARNLVGLGLAAVLAIGTTWLGSERLVLRPARVLLAATRRLGAGDPSARVGAPYQPGELGVLAHAFDNMAAALQARDADACQAREVQQEAERRFRSEIDQRRREAEIIADIAHTINASPDPDTVLQQVVAGAQELCMSDAAAIALRDATGTMVLRRWVGLDLQASAVYTIEPGTGIGAPVLLAGQPVHADHSIEDPPGNPDHVELGRAQQIVAAMGVPIRRGDHVEGLLYVGNRSTRSFSNQDQAILTRLADHAAIAIQDARLSGQLSATGKRLRALSRRLVRVEEAERRHIARELHDEVGQALTGLKLSLEMSARLAGDALSARLGEAQALADELIGQVRRLSLDLRPAMLDDLGLLPALLWHIERYTARTGVALAFEHAGLDRRFPPDVETAAYRIVQEALTNVARHAGVREAALRIGAADETLRLVIQDHGTGFTAESALAGYATSGLAGMHERAVLLGGRLTVESAPGAGTCVTAELPLGARGERKTEDGA